MGKLHETPTPEERATGGRLGTHGIPLILLNVVAVGLASHFLNDQLEEWGGDNVRFLLLAEAIARGKGYVDLYLVGTPAHTHYPPVFPLLLSPLVAWGLPLIALKGVAAAFSLAGLNVSYFFFARIHGRLTSLLIVLSTACCGTFLDSGLSVMSEGPYFFFSMAGIHLARRSLERVRRPFLVAAAAGLLLGLAMLTRAAGVVLAPALAGFALIGRVPTVSFRNRFTRLFIVGVVACSMGGGWLAWTWTHKTAASGNYLRELLTTPTVKEKIEARVARQADPAPNLLTRPVNNLWDFFTRLASTPMPRQVQALGPSSTRGFQLGFALLCSLLSLLALAALVSRLVFRRDLHDLYVFFYGLLLLMWVGGGTRLLMPLLPFLLGYLFEGAVTVGSLAAKPGTPRSVLVGRIVLAFSLAANVAVTFHFPLIHDRLTGRYARWWHDYLRASCDIASVATRGQLVIASPDGVPYYLGGIQAARLPVRGTATEMLRAVLDSSADFLIVTPLQKQRYGRLIPMTIREHPEHFRSIARYAEVEAFAVEREPGATAERPFREPPPGRSTARCAAVLP